LGLYAADACLARGRFVTDMAAWGRAEVLTLDPPTRRR
jgi:hypothetical protein